jgi:hypothetical protein
MRRRRHMTSGKPEQNGLAKGCYSCPRAECLNHRSFVPSGRAGPVPGSGATIANACRGQCRATRPPRAKYHPRTPVMTVVTRKRRSLETPPTRSMFLEEGKGRPRRKADQAGSSRLNRCSSSKANSSAQPPHSTAARGRGCDVGGRVLPRFVKEAVCRSLVRAAPAQPLPDRAGEPDMCLHCAPETGLALNAVPAPAPIAARRAPRWRPVQLDPLWRRPSPRRSRR